MLSPRDIRNLKNSFKKKSFGGGYDTQDVDQHLASLAERWESVLDDRRHAEEKVAELEAKLEHYEKVELALQEALETARDTARRTEEAADRKARLIVEEAELRAQRIVQEAEHERYGLRQDLSTLTNRQNEVAARLRGFLMSELEILAQFQGEDPVGFIKLVGSSERHQDLSLEAPIESPRLVSPLSDVIDDDVEGLSPEALAVEELASGADDFGYDQEDSDDVGDPVHSVDLDASELDAADEATIAMASSGEMPSDAEAPSSEPARRSIPSNPWPEAEPPSASPRPWGITPAAPDSQGDVAEDATPSVKDADAIGPTTPPAAPGWTSPVATFPPASGADAPESSDSGAPNGWSLRSLVTGESDDSPAGSQAERDKIRRILDDLD